MLEVGTELASGVKWYFLNYFTFISQKENLLSNKTQRSLGIESIKEHLMSLNHQQTFIELN